MPSFFHLKDKRGLKDKAPAREGYHHSLLPPSPIYSSTSWPFTHKFTPCVPNSGTKLEISVNIYARIQIWHEASLNAVIKI